MQAKDKGASSWLNAVPLEEQAGPVFEQATIQGLAAFALQSVTEGFAEPLRVW